MTEKKIRAYNSADLLKPGEEVSTESEKQYWDIFNISGDAIFILDMNGNIVDVNPAACKLYGYSRDEFFKLEPEDLIHSDYHSLFNEFFDRIFQEGELSSEAKNIRKDGTTIDIEVRFKTFEYKRHRYLLNFVRDITTQKRKLEKLEKYQYMVESAQDAIFFKDLQSRYIVVNNKTLEVFGLPREKVIGKNDYELMPDQKEAQKNIKDDQTVFQTGKTAKITKHMTATNGKEYWFQAVKVPQFDVKGNIVGLVGVARDITAQKQAEEAKRKTEENYKKTIENIFKFVPEGLLVFTDKVNLSKQNKAFQDIVKEYANKLNYTEQELTELIVEQVRNRIINKDYANIKISPKKDRKTKNKQNNF